MYLLALFYLNRITTYISKISTDIIHNLSATPHICQVNLVCNQGGSYWCLLCSASSVLQDNVDAEVSNCALLLY